MRLWTLVVVVVLGGCATAPFDLSGVDETLTPDAALQQLETVRGRRVAWGGTIINSRNLKDTTEIEVLGYPLARSGRPDLSAPPQRRFLVVRDGYLETADYRNGRVISAVGAIGGTRSGTVGEAPYVYPVLKADEITLWPIGESRRSEPNIHFGIGIGILR